MSRVRLWVLIGVAVAIAAFVTGVVRGATGTSPFEVGPPSPSASPTG